jgi:hypothetical protein
MARTGGRQKGTPNKITTAFKEAVRIVYEDIGGHKAFAEWARENPTEFYKIAARLIPTEIATRSDDTLTVVIRRLGDSPDENTVAPMLPARIVEH